VNKQHLSSIEERICEDIPSQGAIEEEAHRVVRKTTFCVWHPSSHINNGLNEQSACS